MKAPDHALPRWKTPMITPLDWAALGGISLLALSVEGWSASLVMVSGALSYALIKTAPAWATTIREVGFAFVDVRIRYRRELSSIRDQLREIRTEAIQKAEEVEKSASEKALDLERKAVERDMEVERRASERRHALASQMGGELDKFRLDLLDAYDEIGRLKARLGRGDARDAEAINEVSDSVLVVAEKVDPDLPGKLKLPRLDNPPDPE